MKLHQLDRSIDENKSVSVRKNVFPYFLKLWHKHVELELVYIIKSTGTRFIGDSIEKFDKGDLVLIGKDLPHLWLNDKSYFNPNSELSAEAIGIHFKETFLGETIFTAPEMIHLGELIKLARRGIQFLDVSPDLVNKIESLLNLKGFEKKMNFIYILNDLANHKKIKILASNGYTYSESLSDKGNLDEIYDYILKNFNKKINLETAAKIANMNPSAFSRYFKKTNRKTFSKYLNEIRIGYACKLLIDGKIDIARICYESGFNNLSNFNRQFRIIKLMTPSAYAKEHQM